MNEPKQDMRQRSSVIVRFAFAFLAGTVALGACTHTIAVKRSSPASTNSTTSTSSTTSRAAVGQDLVPLPTSGLAGSGSGYAEVASGHGIGNKDIGVFRIRAGRLLLVQQDCEGPPGVLLAHIFLLGRCNGEPIGVKLTAQSDRLVVDVRASAKTTWAVYISQPTS
jgi:hypothetical protein